MKGLIFCHGREHRPIPEQFRQSDIDWIYIDQKENANPDIAIDIFDKNLFKYVKRESIDVILTQHCPINRLINLANIMAYLDLAQKFLKPGGTFYLDTFLFNISSAYREKNHRKGIQVTQRYLFDLYQTHNPEAIAEMNRYLNFLTEEMGYSRWGLISDFPAMVGLVK